MVFAIGYMMYIIGWGTLLRYVCTVILHVFHNELIKQSYLAFSAHHPHNNQDFFAFWYCVVAGPLVFILCLLRAVSLLEANAHYVLMVIVSLHLYTSHCTSRLQEGMLAPGRHGRSIHCAA